MANSIVKRSPGTSKADAKSIAHAATALIEAAANLPAKQRARLAVRRSDLTAVIAEVVSKIEEPRALRGDAQIAPKTHVEIGRGTGLGERIDRAEGLRRLDEYATSLSIEAWAGPVAGAVELARRHGISRSTLHDWQRRGVIIGLLRGTRKQVFPLAQFLDGRPLEGIAEVLNVAKTPRTAWLWLRSPHPTGDGTAPIERLRAGRMAEVIEAARGDFGQQ
jgi:hypothetical protein